MILAFTVKKLYNVHVMNIPLESYAEVSMHAINIYDEEIEDKIKT